MGWAERWRDRVGVVYVMQCGCGSECSACGYVQTVT